MRIAYCTESLPPLVDGVTRTLSELVATLRETGHEFTFLSAVKPDPGLLWRDRVHTVPSVPFPLYPYYRVCLPAARKIGRASCRERVEISAATERLEHKMEKLWH